jgi:CheY-like chemotaxis protein
LNILVAEDDDVSRRLLRQILGRLGHTVKDVPNGKAAFQAWRSGEYHAIVSDWMMPEMDGLELCTKIRNERSQIYTYFILLTANAGREQIETAMKQGVDDFLAKPVREVDLFNRLRVAERIIGFFTELANIKRILTVCMYSGKVKEEDGSWVDLQEFITRRLGTKLSHGISPEAFEEHVKPQLEELKSHKEKDPAGEALPQ